jgi:hypothetical protein
VTGQAEGHVIEKWFCRGGSRATPAVVSFCVASAVFLLTSPIIAQKTGAPAFNQYPATVEKATARSIDFKRYPNARSFRTRLSQALAGGVNFAGHYVVAGWGCGAGCISGAIIDARTGNVFFPEEFAEIGVWYGKDNYAEEPVGYRKNSRLLIILGVPGSKEGQPDKPSGEYYYEWVNDQLKLIKFVPKKMGE